MLPPAPPPDPNYPPNPGNPSYPFADTRVFYRFKFPEAENHTIPPPLPPRVALDSPLPPPEPSNLASPSE